MANKKTTTTEVEEVKDKVNSKKNETTSDDSANAKFEELLQTLNKKIEEQDAKMKVLEEDKDKQIEDLKKALAEKENGANLVKQITSDDIIYQVKTISNYGLYLVSPNGEIEVSLPYEVWVDVSERELREIFKKPTNQDFFKSGLCSVKQNGVLEKFRIKVKNVINEDTLRELIDTGSENTIITTFNEWTGDKANDVLSHAILYRVAHMVIDGDFDDVPHHIYSSIERYFGVQLINIIDSLKLYLDIK